MAGAVSCLLGKASRAFDRRANNGSSCGSSCGAGCGVSCSEDGGRRGLKEKGVIDAGWCVMGASSRVSFAQELSEGRSHLRPCLICALCLVGEAKVGSHDWCTSPNPRGGAPTASPIVTAGAPLVSITGALSPLERRWSITGASLEHRQRHGTWTPANMEVVASAHHHSQPIIHAAYSSSPILVMACIA